MEANQPVRSFSGAHPFRPACLQQAVHAVFEFDPDEFESEGVDPVQHVLDLVQMVDRGECPSCGRDLPTGNFMPAGSRLTRCRCVPVCVGCGNLEALHGIEVTAWPMPPEDVDALNARMLASAKLTDVTLMGEGGAPVLITEDGVTEIRLRDHPGGWAEFGYDDTDDEQERAGR